MSLTHSLIFIPYPFSYCFQQNLLASTQTYTVRIGWSDTLVLIIIKHTTSNSYTIIVFKTVIWRKYWTCLSLPRQFPAWCWCASLPNRVWVFNNRSNHRPTFLRDPSRRPRHSYRPSHCRHDGTKSWLGGVMMNKNSTVPSWSIPLLLQTRRERLVYSTRYAKAALITTIILFCSGRKENSIFCSCWFYSFLTLLSISTELFYDQLVFQNYP